VAIDLAPHEPLDALRARFAEAARAPGGPRLARLLPASLPARVFDAVLRQAGVEEPNPALSRVEARVRNRLVDALKGLEVPISGTLGWDEAEVTAGGLALDAVERTTMAVRDRPGLFVFGELLDLSGPIGGLNFQAAFATAELAARAAAG
jgi:predicted flavoprotein YhiN